jgi:hypothetical protein
MILIFSIYQFNIKPSIMKKTIFTLLGTLMLMVFVNQTFAQVPQGINYQSVARDNNGNVLANQAVSIRLSILSGSPAGTAVYVETHAKTTDGFGLFSLKIGQGSVVSGNFSTISWGSNAYFYKVEIDPTGGIAYEPVVTNQFVSVPYALYAAQSGTPGTTGPQGIPGPTGATGAQGIQGIQGTTGAIGLAGAQGIPGPTGAVGAVGTQGIQGPTGQTGATGPSGALNAWSLTGNAGTFDSINFIGTTDYNTPLCIKVSNQKAGRIDPAGPVFLGYWAGKINTATNNTGIGYEALQSNTSGTGNAAFGFGTLVSSTSSYNTAIGFQALTTNTIGDRNTAVGMNALNYNSSGKWNTAGGFEGLFNNISGNNNTAFGYSALASNTSGTSNTAIGHWADVGSGNLSNATAIGANAIVNTSNSLVLGNNANVGIGTSSPGIDLDGSSTALTISSPITYGRGVLQLSNYSYDVGAYLIGEMSFMQSANLANYRTVAYIGSWAAYGTATKRGGDLRFFTQPDNTAGALERMRIKETGYVGIGTGSPDNLLTVNGSADKPGGGSWATFSDARVKKEVTAFMDGLNIIKQINPITYKYNGLGGYKDDGKQYVGIIAQDIQKIAPYMIEVKKKKLHESDSTTTDLLMYDGSAFTYVLINAIKEQQGIIESQEKTNEIQNKKIDDLQKQIYELQTLIKTK